MDTLCLLMNMLVIEDVAKDPRFANNPFLIENGIRFYAGAPLRSSSGFAIGSLCVIDTKPRSFSALRTARFCRRLRIDLMFKVEIEYQRTTPEPLREKVSSGKEASCNRSLSV